MVIQNCSDCSFRGMGGWLVGEGWVAKLIGKGWVAKLEREWLVERDWRLSWRGSG